MVRDPQKQNERKQDQKTPSEISSEFSIEAFILKWVLATIFFSLALGGIPWRFPAQGKYLLEKWIQEAQVQKSGSAMTQFQKE
jgi:hypothetical protein